MQIQIINKSGHPLPQYESAHAAGLDIRARLEVPLVLEPMGRALVPTGLFVAIPKGCEVQIRPRSGLAFKHGVTVLNSPGTIDADYRGEIKILLINLGPEPFTINDGERIAQMVMARHEQVQWEEVAQLTETARGHGGFGHTGS